MYVYGQYYNIGLSLVPNCMYTADAILFIVKALFVMDFKAGILMVHEKNSNNVDP